MIRLQATRAAAGAVRLPQSINQYNTMFKTAKVKRGWNFKQHIQLNIAIIFICLVEYY